jgi:hypothetical protein
MRMKRILSNPIFALAAGLCLRLFFVLKIPGSSGDTVLYEQIAANWVKHHTYAMDVDGVLTPVEMRMPGYPAYLALVYWLTGRTGDSAHLWAMLGQIAVDLLGCCGIAALATTLVVLAGRDAEAMRVFVTGLWLAALCPFTANYTAVLLTESFAIFLTSFALVFMTGLVFLTRDQLPIIEPRLRRRMLDVRCWAGLFGLVVGTATLFRPEAPLLLITAWIGCALVLLPGRKIRDLVRVVFFSGLACLIPLAPWAVRNAITLHEVQLLAPKNSNLPGELVPYGFMAWEKTWLYRVKDCYLASWKLNGEAIDSDSLPAKAFDTQEEKERVARILEKYNVDLTLTPEEDEEFGQLARERSARHPFRTYFYIPAQRVVTLWLTPRIELLPVSGKVFPVAQTWEDDPVDLKTTAGLFLLNILYIAFAAFGAWRMWRGNSAMRPVIATWGLFILLRTAFLTTLETPEPRYVLVCYPIVLAFIASLAAEGWGGVAPAVRP